MVLDRIFGGEEPTEFELQLENSETGEDETVKDYYDRFQSDVGEDVVEEFLGDLENERAAAERIPFVTNRRKSPLVTEARDPQVTERVSEYAEAGLLEEFQWEDFTFYTFTERGEHVAEFGEEIVEYVEKVEEALEMEDEEKEKLGRAETNDEDYSGETSRIGSGEYVNWKLMTADGSKEPMATQKGEKLKQKVLEPNAEKDTMQATTQKSGDYSLTPLAKMHAVDQFKNHAKLDEEVRKQKTHEAFEELLSQAENRKITEFDSEVEPRRITEYEEAVNKLREGIIRLSELMEKEAIPNDQQLNNLLVDYSLGMDAQQQELGFACLGEQPKPDYSPEDRLRILHRMHNTTKVLYQEMEQEYF